uniref:Calponin-homology (CH) domain-containing protein n=1 Tax=Anopheles coluzzii TaxID=1518534 RepID=A0A8W7PW61_ANOCL
MAVVVSPWHEPELSTFGTRVAGKRDRDQEREAQHWIETVIGEKFPAGHVYEDCLRDGILLCRLMNRLSPGIVPKINTTGGDYKMMDNINQ